MNANNQIMTISQQINEEAEFRRLERITDTRKLCEEISAEEMLRARNRQKRAQREQRQRLARNCKLMLLGAVSAACVTVAIAAWRTTPALSLFPAVLAVVALSRGTNA